MPHLPPDAPPPRLCLVEKATPDQEYGYNLHAERGKDQFVGTVDKGSPADRAGLRMGDRIYAVNGVSIQGESHRKVVERIKSDPMRCELLVIDEAGAAWYKEHNITISPTMANIVRGGEEKQTAPTSGGSPPPAAWYAPAQTGKDPVFVAPPPPVEEAAMGGKPKATLCLLEKRGPSDEFGFNLHAEKGKGHFIGAVDAGGIGDRAGLRMAQRIVGVNGILVYPSTPHKEVVALIKRNPLSTSLLVAAEDVDAWYKQHNEGYSFEWAEDGSRPAGGQHTHEADVHKEHHEEEEAAAVEALAEVIAEELVLERAHEFIEEERHHEEHHHHHHDLPDPVVEHTDAEIMAAIFGVQMPPPVQEQSDEDIMTAVFGTTVVAAPAPEPAPRKLDPRETPVMSPEPALRTTTGYSNGSHAAASPTEHNGMNGHHHHQHSPPEKRDIFDLSAKEARELLKAQNRRRDPRRVEMSLEEKHRIVSSM